MLSANLTVPYGFPVARITRRFGEHEQLVFRLMRARFREIFAVYDRLGIDFSLSDPQLLTLFGDHQMGTCRMGDDPNTSVVNKFHRAHDVPNLFIVDGSSFVTGGRNHPTMTISALAFRAADHLVRAARNYGMS